ESEALQHLDVADPAIALDDDFQHDVAGHSTLPRLVGVIRPDFAQELRRLDAAARPIRAATDASARAGSDAAAVAFAEAGARSLAGTAVFAGSVAVGRDRRFHQDTNTIAPIR